MQTDILLKQINEHIQQLKGKIQDFEGALQPDSILADNLNEELHKLTKLVGAYAFIRQQHELSPRLDLHMKIAEKIKPVEEPAEIPIKQEIKTEPVQEPVVSVKPEEPVKTSSVQNEPIQVSINDKFRFINELFKANSVEYGIAIEQINAFTTWNDTQVYLNGLRNIYGWKDDHDMANKLFELGKKRFA